MKAVVAAFNQEKAPVGAFSVIVKPVVEPMDRFTALVPNVPCWLGHIGKRKFIIFSIYNSENCPREMFLRGEVFRDGLFMKVEYKRNPLWLRWTGASTQPFEGLLRKLL